MPGHLVIGTYTEKLPHVDGKAAGILSARYDENGAVGDIGVLAKVRNPSWVTVGPDARHVYAIMEVLEFEGRPSGGVAAFARDTTTGQLTELNTRPSGGVEPAHVALDRSERFILVANYLSGSVAVFARNADGGFGELVDHVQRQGASVHPDRQTGPHAHQVLLDPVTGDFLVPDLGVDAVLTYRIDAAGKLTERADARINTEPGSGPRHLEFHPNQRALFLLHELDNTVTALRRDGDRFVAVQTTSTLPESFVGNSQSSAIHVSPSGEYVFTANRGHDSIAMFRFDESAGTLELVHVAATQGREPRDFRQTPDGKFLLVANQDSNTIVSFAVDEKQPGLRAVATAEAPSPVCLQFV